MKIENLIKKLEEIKSSHGDIEVYMTDIISGDSDYLDSIVGVTVSNKGKEEIVELW